MPILITTTVSQVQDWTPDEKLAAIQRIVKANELRTAKLPFDTNANIRASYATILGEAAAAEHLKALSEATDASGLSLAGFSDDQKTRIRKAAIAAAQSGKSAESVVTAIEAAAAK